MNVRTPRVSRRAVLAGGVTTAALATLPLGKFSTALAATEEERIIAAAKKAVTQPVDVGGIMWSNYQTAVAPVAKEFAAATGVSMTKLQDISTFDIPQRAMAEALSKSPEFDFFHLDSNMIPSLASAGLLEPLDEYMAAADFKLDAVGLYGKFTSYKGKTYGMMTDGNVHVQYIRKDLFENADEQKRYADKTGKPMAWPETWEDELTLYKWFHRPDQNIWASGSLRDRGSSIAWFYMYLYSAGGFPFTDDMEPNINTPQGEYAVQTFVNLKEVSHPEAPGWGTPQMIPRIVAGNTFGQQYWDGTIALAENPEKSKTTGKWLYGSVPGSRFSGKLLKRSISAPSVSIVVNRHSPRKVPMAYLAMYLATGKNSTLIAGDPVNTFHDPWHVEHFKPGSLTEKTYTVAGLNAIKKNLEIVTPPIYLTGLLEFETEVKRNISEAYVGDKTAKQAVKDIEDGWSKAIRRIGKSKLREELATYKSLFPKVDVPS